MPGQLAHQPERGQGPVKQPHPEDLGEVDVHQRLDPVDVPVLYGPKKFQFGPRKNVPATTSRNPQDD